ncbi:MAG: hypothetical protein VX831_05310 [Candidatus Thermoplasmatota archaeon]|nr:hypothetical protein [Candidatus Thermoplasmatota archaeon]MEC8681587.1 hypothetical protein [Candidatus Thermoplasmatota archaeon]MEE2974643.1 hypothetical protein [Candidatus Thermoplasmatota archaeon]
MSDGSVNVESRTSSQDKRWTIMAALLGTNTALLLFQGIEQAKSPDNVRELALAIIAAALPFQAIYFLIYTFVLEHEPQLPPERMRKLDLASALCQVVSYASLGGVALMWYNMSSWVGLSFGVSSIFAIVLIRNVMAPVEALGEDAGTPQNPSS